MELFGKKSLFADYSIKAYVQSIFIVKDKMKLFSYKI